MKNDASFKLVAAIIIAGVIVALVSPAPTTATQSNVATETAAAAAPHAAQ